MLLLGFTGGIYYCAICVLIVFVLPSLLYFIFLTRYFFYYFGSISSCYAALLGQLSFIKCFIDNADIQRIAKSTALTHHIIMIMVINVSKILENNVFCHIASVFLTLLFMHDKIPSTKVDLIL